MSCINRRLTSRRRCLAAMRGLGRVATESARQVPRWWWMHQGVSWSYPSRNRLMMHAESGRHITPQTVRYQTFRMLTFGSRGSPATHPEGAARVVSQCKINDIVRRAAQNTRRPFLRAWQSRISHVRRHGFGGRSGHLDEGCVDTTCHSSLARLCGTACRSPHSRQDYARLGLPVTTPTSPAGAYR